MVNLGLYLPIIALMLYYSNGKIRDEHIDYCIDFRGRDDILVII